MTDQTVVNFTVKKTKQLRFDLILDSQKTHKTVEKYLLQEKTVPIHHVAFRHHHFMRHPSLLVQPEKTKHASASEKIMRFSSELHGLHVPVDRCFVFTISCI